MPNETWNKLVVEGPEEDVQRFVDRVVSKELDYDGEPYVLDFEAHVPVPPESTRDDIRVWSDRRLGMPAADVSGDHRAEARVGSCTS